jgi:hypothetical protein
MGELKTGRPGEIGRRPFSIVEQRESLKNRVDRRSSSFIASQRMIATFPAGFQYNIAESL